MKPTISPWSAILGLLLLAMIASILGLLPVNPIDIFWAVITVACVWAIMRIFFPAKKR